MTQPKRLLRLYRALLTRRRITTAQAADFLGVDKQKARRDLAALGEASVGVESVGEGVEHAWVLRGGPAGMLRLGAGDAIALHLGQELLSFLEGTAVGDWLSEMEEKLAPATVTEAEQLASRIRERIVYLAEPSRPYDHHTDVVDTAIDAVLKNDRVDLVYTSHQGPRTFLGACPIALVVYRRALYLLLLPQSGDVPRRLAIDRIQTVKRRRDPFTYPRDLSPRALLAQTFGIVDDGRPPERVLLRFDASVAQVVDARRWHPGQLITPTADGGRELSFVANGPELARFALEWGDKVQVIEPAWLRERVIDELRGALARYA